MQNQGITFCSNCGGQNTVDNNFCLYCGNALSKTNQQNTTVSNQNGVVQPQPQQYQQQYQPQPQQYQQRYQPQQYQQVKATQQKPTRKLGFLGWFGIIMMGLGSFSNIFILATAVVLGIIYFTMPSSKNVIIIIIRVIGAIDLVFIVLGLILLGTCLGFISGITGH